MLNPTQDKNLNRTGLSFFGSNIKYHCEEAKVLDEW